VAFNPSIYGCNGRDLLRGASFFGKGYISREYILGLIEPYAVFYTYLLLTALISLLGWISFVVIIIALLFFLVKGFVRCVKQKSSLGLFVSTSIMMIFSIQAICYIAFNLSFLLSSPITLPLISYDNAATIINLMLIGLMLSVF
jgi:cell division protein FtsW (lipid II flippase)